MVAVADVVVDVVCCRTSEDEDDGVDGTEKADTPVVNDNNTVSDTNTNNNNPLEKEQMLHEEKRPCRIGPEGLKQMVIVVRFSLLFLSSSSSQSPLTFASSRKAHPFLVFAKHVRP